MNTFDRHIRYFLVIAELKSLSRAAEAMGLTQSGISRQLAALEEHVGLPLFYRTGRGVELTPAIGGGLAPVVAIWLLSIGDGSPKYVTWYLVLLGLVALISAWSMRSESHTY